MRDLQSLWCWCPGLALSCRAGEAPRSGSGAGRARARLRCPCPAGRARVRDAESQRGAGRGSPGPERPQRRRAARKGRKAHLEGRGASRGENQGVTNPSRQSLPLECAAGARRGWSGSMGSSHRTNGEDACDSWLLEKMLVSLHLPWRSYSIFCAST